MTQRKMKDSTFRVSASIERALRGLCRDGFSGDADEMFRCLLCAHEEQLGQFIRTTTEQIREDFAKSLRGA